MTKFTVNGREVDLDIDPDTPLLWALRDELRLTGTKFGCGVAQCGACTVMLDGMPGRSCVTPISMVIEFIPCNDFSFYDIVLDTAVLLGIVPKRYRELNVSKLDTYFAMARG